MPAISLSYEKAELDIMNIPPRDAKKDRLVDLKLLFRAYAYIGILAGCCAFVGYFITMNMHGYTPKMLWESRRDWEGNGTFPRWAYNQTAHQYRLVDTVRWFCF